MLLWWGSTRRPWLLKYPRNGNIVWCYITIIHAFLWLMIWCACHSVIDDLMCMQFCDWWFDVHAFLWLMIWCACLSVIDDLMCMPFCDWWADVYAFLWLISWCVYHFTTDGLKCMSFCECHCPFSVLQATTPGLSSINSEYSFLICAVNEKASMSFLIY